MLELKSITKVYPAGGENVMALKGIDLTFRRSEFVSILGPSGCGKTTLLNLIGGLDHYTDGDLVINGRSTKEYTDRDWDTYRNHSVGFVFQSYNLIPHQTVLQNVELALTLSGVGRAERRRRAAEALARVGLSDQMKKRPSEMSGGQMQRVAIARAIVNDPDIILADEPTGALDTETSVQVMEILKEISRDRLVIMVTHNPDLADTYSTRIVRMLDGKITGDSAPLTPEELAEGRESQRDDSKTKRPSMSLFTSFGLSLKNLFTKKGRTALTSFAGSIGIIGIALIYAVSQGTTNYINAVQEETLTSYPLTIESETLDVSGMLSAFVGKAESIGEHEKDAIYPKAMLYAMMDAFSALEEQENDLKSFRAWLEKEKGTEGSKVNTALSTVQYTYNTDLMIYTETVDGTILRSDTRRLMTDLIADSMGIDMDAMAENASGGMGGMSMMSGANMSASTLWRELIPGRDGEPISDVTRGQYDLVYGRWPEAYNEVILFVDETQELNDLTLYALGLKKEEDIKALLDAAVNQQEAEYKNEKWSYEEVCGRTYRTVLPAARYAHDEKAGLWTDLSETETGLRYLYDNGIDLKVTGIVKPNQDAVSGGAGGGMGYTHLLTDYLLAEADKAASVQAQRDDPENDIFTGLPFKPEEEMTAAEKAAALDEYVEGLDEAGRAALYVELLSTPSDEEVAQAVQAQMAGMKRADMEAALTQAMQTQTGMAAEEVANYLANMADEELSGFMAQAIGEQYKAGYAAKVAEQTAQMPAAQLSQGLAQTLAALSEEDRAARYDAVTEYSSSTYEQNLVKLGSLDPERPSSISLYAATFENKDLLEEAIAEYNDTVEDLQEIHYTDVVGILLSSVTTIINAITYVLIAFVGVSLVVSSIMIGVITLISVQERTKEIGILRAIGASKKNVSGMFNAETVIIGFTSGLLGVAITYLLCIPINLILHALTDINNLSATLPIPVALVLIAISMVLTLIAGIIPSRSAARKDPVVALRTE